MADSALQKGYPEIFRLVALDLGYGSKERVAITSLALPSPSIITSLTGSGYIATASTSPLAHGLSVGDRIMVSNVDPADYNGVWVVATVANLATFTYTKLTAPVSPPETASQAASGGMKVTLMTAVATCSGNHGLEVQDETYVSGASNDYFNGMVMVTAVPDVRTFKYILPATSTSSVLTAPTGTMRSTALSLEQITEINEIIKTGLARFYFPETGYSWSFFRLETSISIVAGTTVYALPDNWGEMLENPVLTSPTRRPKQLKLRGEGVLRELAQNYPERKGEAEYVAVRIKAPTGTAVQKYELLVWPEPEAAITMTVRYHADPSAMLTDAAPIPLGGMSHGDAIEAACLAVAEERKKGERGLHYSVYQERLLASIRRDQAKRAPDFYGADGRRAPSGGPEVYATFNGTRWD